MIFLAFSFNILVKLTTRTFQDVPEPIENLVKVEGSDDNEKTQIFSNHRPEPSPKPYASKAKGTSQMTNSPKEKQTSTAGHADKEGKDLANYNKEN